MKRMFVIACGVLLLGAIAAAQYTPGSKGGSTGPPPPEKQKGPQLRSVNGRVTSSEDAPPPPIFSARPVYRKRSLSGGPDVLKP